jgi:hypothetical protein
MHRRTFLKSGLSAYMLGMAAGRTLAGQVRLGGVTLTPPCPDTGALPLAGTRPVLELPRHLQSVMVDGIPFSPAFFGDDFENTQIPFHVTENEFPGGEPPAPTEDVPLVVIGGGLSGLTTAYLLRRHRPVMLELHDRFGGVSQGEQWRGSEYSLGGAYFITPDYGSFLDRLYRELGARHAHRLDTGGNPVEINGVISNQFWSGQDRPEGERAAFARYAEIVAGFANDTYPDIPLPDGKDNAWILELDGRTFRADLEARMGMPIPASLAAGIQGYFYSSFNAGWEEISAAAGWNFIAAEEYGRWVCPGGNSFLASAMWEELSKLDRGVPRRCPSRHLRARCRAVDVRLRPGDRVQVTYKDSEGKLRSLLARRVVIATPKHIAKRLVHGLETIDPEKYLALSQLDTRPYVVANVLVNARLKPEFYDLFLLGDPALYPMREADAETWNRVPDVVDGRFAGQGELGEQQRAVLTLYWALPYFHARFRLIFPDSWQVFADMLAPQVREIVTLLGLRTSDIEQVRMARWGHAMPIATVGFLAQGAYEKVRRPIEDRIYFVNQDNWALPAVETCLLEAEYWAPIVAAGLG